MYNKVAPKVIPIIVKRSPNHFPKINPANSAIGAPKPAAKTHRVTNKINNRPECKPYGQLPRECVDHKVLEVFPVAQSSSKSHDGPACGVNWQYTVCAYSPFKKGIMGKAGKKGLKGDKGENMTCDKCI